jgi:hypothetical protein
LVQIILNITYNTTCKADAEVRLSFVLEGVKVTGMFSLISPSLSESLNPNADSIAAYSDSAKEFMFL